MLLRPHAVGFSALVHDVVPIEGGYAVLTATAIEIVDGDLRPVETIAGAERHTTLHVLADGRFVVSSDLTKPRIARRGGALTEIPDLERVTVYPTRDGFIGVASGKAWIDRGGEGRWVDVAHGTLGNCAWGDRVVCASSTGLSVIDAAGEVANIELTVSAKPTALGEWLAIPRANGIAIYDAKLEPIASLPATSEATLARLGELVITCDAEGISAWALDDALVASVDSVDALIALGTQRGYVTRREVHQLQAAAPDPERATEIADAIAAQQQIKWLDGVPAQQRWHHELADAQEPHVIGERIVIGTTRAAKIFDVAGQAIDVALAGSLWDARAFGDGIALQVGEHADITWWRPNAELVRLAHDIGPRLIRDVPAGLAAIEDNHLYLWRTDVQGPELVPVVTSIPLEVPIVVEGRTVHAITPKRFVVLAMTPERKPVAIQPDAVWRPAIAKDAALAVVQKLVARDVEGELPPLPTDGTIAEQRAKLAQLPPSQTAALHVRALYAPTTLDKHARDAALWAKELFFAELGAALGASGRAIAAAVRGRKYPLVPPREVAGYDYLGTFTTSGALVVADPAYVGSKRAPGAFSLAVRVKGLEGLWYVFARNGDGEYSDRTAELVAIHTDGFDTYATELLGTIGVDSACAGFWDKACPKRDRDAPVEEGIQGGLGALGFSGLGDGMYPVYAGKIRGIVVKLRLGFLEGTEIDRTFAPSKHTGREYSPRTKFSLGETIEHPKFGAGTVTAVSDGGKIDVTFADGKRTLVHGK